MKPEHNKMGQITRLQILVEDQRRYLGAIGDGATRKIVESNLTAMEARLKNLAEAVQLDQTGASSGGHSHRAETASGGSAISAGAIFQQRAEQAAQHRSAGPDPADGEPRPGDAAAIYARRAGSSA
jgi:hypothetical protein